MSEDQEYGAFTETTMVVDGVGGKNSKKNAPPKVGFAQRILKLRTNMVLAALHAGFAILFLGLILVFLFATGSGDESTPRIRFGMGGLLRLGFFLERCEENGNVVPPRLVGRDFVATLPCVVNRHWVLPGGSDVPSILTPDVMKLGFLEGVDVPTSCTGDTQCLTFETHSSSMEMGMSLNILCILAYFFSAVVHIGMVILFFGGKDFTPAEYGVVRWVGMAFSWPFLIDAYAGVFGVSNAEALFFVPLVVMLVGGFWAFVNMLSPFVLFDKTKLKPESPPVGSIDYRYGGEPQVPADMGELLRRDHLLETEKERRKKMSLGERLSRFHQRGLLKTSVLVSWVPFLLVLFFLFLRYSWSVRPSSAGDFGNEALPSDVVLAFWLGIVPWFMATVFAHVTSPLLQAETNQFVQTKWNKIGNMTYMVVDVIAKVSLGLVIFFKYTKSPGESYVLRV